MRKFMFGLLAALFSVVFAAVPASAEYQENAPEKDSEQLHTTSAPVDCTFHNNTYATVQDTWAYHVGDAIDFEITLSDPENTVANILFSVGINQKGWSIQEGSLRTVTWTAPSAGEWEVFAQLYDVNGQEIIPTGDCDGAITVYDYTEPAHPDNPDVIEPPTEPEPEPVDETCEDDDPSTLVPVNNADGSTTWYSPGGAFCGTVLPEATNAPPSVQPASQPAVQLATVVTTAAAVAELPRTGVKDTLPFIGAGILGVGVLFGKLGRKRAARFAA